MNEDGPLCVTFKTGIGFFIIFFLDVEANGEDNLEFRTVSV